jgi:hypothetical protein
MTATLLPTTTSIDVPGIEPMVSFDFYKNIHKGVRAGLFDLTLSAGGTDPGDVAGRAVLCEQVRVMAHLLEEHAAHENDFVVPVLEVHAPELADVIHEVHPVLDRRVAGIRELAGEVVGIGGARAREAVHALYLELAAFTGTTSSTRTSRSVTACGPSPPFFRSTS